MFRPPRPKPPCWKCDSRTMGCHSHCPKYKDWSRDYKADVSKAYDNYVAEKRINDYTVKAILRSQRRKPGEK